jgi:hypothetical protein
MIIDPGEVTILPYFGGYQRRGGNAWNKFKRGVIKVGKKALPFLQRKVLPEVGKEVGKTAAHLARQGAVSLLTGTGRWNNIKRGIKRVGSTVSTFARERPVSTSLFLMKAPMQYQLAANLLGVGYTRGPTGRYY